MSTLLSALVAAQVALIGAVRSSVHTWSVRSRDQRGQATAEYALVLLGAAAIALLLAAWAAKSGKIGQLFDAVVDQLIGEVS
jgi:Flp pilus assembly pilin Flp